MLWELKRQIEAHICRPGKDKQKAVFCIPKLITKEVVVGNPKCNSKTAVMLALSDPKCGEVITYKKESASDETFCLVA